MEFPATGTHAGALNPIIDLFNGGPVTHPNTLAVQTYSQSRNQVGMYTRGQISVDAVSNTAYGPLLGHVTMEGNAGSGFDSSPSAAIDGAYMQWAGITAGYHTSAFQFIGGGVAWDDLLSAKADPTEQLAYTATFGGGFSATLSLEAPFNESGQRANSTSWTAASSMVRWRPALRSARNRPTSSPLST